MTVKQFTKEKVNQHPEQAEALKRIMDVIYDYEMPNTTILGILELAKLNIIGNIEFTED